MRAKRDINAMSKSCNYRNPVANNENRRKPGSIFMG
nr:MAG TPA: hypothetical protein [Caudoviricetes sp.]